MTDGGLPPGLWLIGLGPGDLGLMTSDAIEHARACEYRFLEGYTATLPEDQEGRLEGLVGNWKRAMRPMVEEPNELLSLARESSVALLVVGDPMQATTHVDLEAHCAEQGVDFSIIPGLSATSLAISLSGLQSYRFGRQVTLPFAYGEYLPTSPLEMIDANERVKYLKKIVTLILIGLASASDISQSRQTALTKAIEKIGIQIPIKRANIQVDSPSGRNHFMILFRLGISKT